MITFVGAIGGTEPAQLNEHIQDALQYKQTLIHQSTFTGRPTTELYASERWVVKIKSEFVFQEKDVEKRAKIACQQEQKLDVYHPHKSWFYFSLNGQLRIANITPRIQPLHTSAPSLISESPEKLYELFQQLIRMYCRVAAQMDKRLDEGLSNFGMDDCGKLYYLDDDIYEWDNFTSLANILAVWIRQLPTFHLGDSQRLAEIIVSNVLENFNSAHNLQVLYGQLRQNLAVSERESECLNLIMQTVWTSCRSARKTPTLTDPQAHQTLNISSEPTTVDQLHAPSNLLSKISEPRFAVLADIHANLPALEVVIKKLRAEGMSQYLILGDIVGYGPHPNECIDYLQTLDCLIVQGNHDYAAATGDTERGFSKLASWAIDWTHEVLDDHHRDWLRSIPPVHQQDHWMAVHGSPIDKHYFYAYVYHMTYQANLDWLEEHKVAVGFHGHSHIQMSYQRSKKGDEKNTAALQKLLANSATLSCPGSTGQPRGGTTQAEYAIYDSEARELTLHRTEYDIALTVEDMRSKQFPPALYERLNAGK